MKGEMNLYSYEGPVMEFNQIIERNWKGRTQAVSESKARNNLTFQFKMKNNRTPDSKITLPGNLVKVLR